jgi:hypothetical protein
MPEKTDYAAELFDLQPVPVSTPGTRETDYAAELFSPDIEVQRHREPTGEISTITGKEKVEFTGKGGPGASYLAHLKAGVVDDPTLKLKIYAAMRFPDLPEEKRLDRYKMFKGEVIYRDYDNKWYPESPDLAKAKLKEFAGETAAHGPSIALGSVLATLGPMGAALGAAGGEGIRKTLAAILFGEKQSTLGNIKSMAIEGGLGLGGEVAGRGLIGMANKAGRIPAGRAGRRVAEAIGADIKIIDPKKALKIKNYYKKKFDVDLFDAQTTESRRLIDKMNLYGDIPATADLVQAAKKIQDEQAYRAVNKFFDDIFPETDEFFAGLDLSEAAQSVIDKRIAAMQKRAKPLYDKAFKQKTEIDITPHIRQLDEMIEGWPRESVERGKLVKLRNMLFRKERLLNKTIDVPESRIKHLDKLKKTVDSILKPTANEPAASRSVKRQIRQIKNNILEDLDKANPTYAKARQSWGDDSEVIELLTKKTMLQNISGLEGENVTNAVRKLFSVRSPQIMRFTRAQLTKESPEAYEAALRVHLQDLFEGVAQSAESGAANIIIFSARLPATRQNQRYLEKQ